VSGVIERIEFTVAGDAVIGDLHLSVGQGPRPAVVVAGPMTSVRTQVTGVYAQALAARGLTALAIDHRHYGDSGGEPRQYEHSGRKIEDLKAALQALAEHPSIDAGRMGLAAVCLGCGYAVHAAIDDPQVKALGLVVGYYRDPDAMRAADPKGFDARVRQGVEARELWERIGQVATIPAAATAGDAAMTTADTTDYYTRRAAVPTYRNELAVMSREHFLPFDVQAAAPSVTQPVLMIHSENGLSPAWARLFHDRLASSVKRLDWIASRGQTDVYDDPAIVAQAAERLIEHFRIHLGRAAPGIAPA